MIRSRTLSAGTGRIPARIFSMVSSTVFPSGTRGRATTVITDWTPPLLELEGEDHPVHLEEHAGVVDLRGELVGEVRDQVLGQPGVHLLIGEDGLPGGLVADVVAQLQTLGDEVLGPDLALVLRQARPCPVIRRLVGEGEPDCGRDGDDDPQEDSRPEEPFGRRLEHRRTHLVWNGQSDGKRPADGREESGCRLGGPDVQAWSNHHRSIRGSAKTVNPDFEEGSDGPGSPGPGSAAADSGANPKLIPLSSRPGRA